MTKKEMHIPESIEAQEGFLKRNKVKIVGMGLGIVAVLGLGIVVSEGLESTGSNFNTFIEDFDSGTMQDMISNAKLAD